MRWFVLRVAGRKAQGIAEQIGDGCWWPTTKKLTKPARKKKPVEVIVPLIPGWIFLHEDQYGKWNHLEGVYGSLKYGKQGVLFVEDHELDGLRSVALRPPTARKDIPEGWEPAIGSEVLLLGLLFGRSGRVVAKGEKGLYKVEMGWMRTEIHIDLLAPMPHDHCQNQGKSVSIRVMGDPEATTS